MHVVMYNQRSGASRLEASRFLEASSPILSFWIAARSSSSADLGLNDSNLNVSILKRFDC